MDWLILVVLLPAVIVAIVLLYGFAGCSPFSVATPPVQEPFDLDATDVEETRITITWKHAQAASSEFVVLRSDVSGEYATVAQGLATSFLDGTGAGTPPQVVTPGTLYTYRVVARDASTRAESAPSAPLTVRSLKFET